MTPRAHWLVSTPARTALAALDGRIDALIDPSDTTLRATATALSRRGGKRLRPALLLLAAEFGELDHRRLLDAAAALELLHLASLYHDDVMDQARTRRHGPSVNARWGEPAAMTAGTFLVARATRILAGLEDACGRETAAAMVRLCGGQLKETENAFNLDLTESAHFDIIAGKTAPLFELPCRLGALLAGVPEAITGALLRYGAGLGLAFQLADDALDLRGTAEALGKGPLRDVREGVYTLSLIRLLGRAAPEARRLRELLGLTEPCPAEIAEVAALALGSGAVDEALEEARSRAAEARDQLTALPRTPARESLCRLADHAVARAS